MPTYEVELTDGRKFHVDADSQPSEADVLAALDGGQGQAKTPTWQETLAKGLSLAGPVSGLGNPMGGVTEAGPERQGLNLQNLFGFRPEQMTPEFQQQVSDVASGYRQGVAQGTRLVGPLAAPGAGSIANAALSAGSELTAQLIGDEEFRPRAIAARALQGAIPLVNKFGALVRAPLNAALQGGGATLADLIDRGEINPLNSALGAGLGGAGGLVSSVAAPIARGVSGYLEARGGGIPVENLPPGMAQSTRQATVPEAIRAGFAEAFRPVELTQEQAAIQRARNELNTQLQQNGGPVAPIPIGLSEAIRSPQLVREMSIPGAEVSPEAMRNVAELTSFVASNLSRSSRGPNEVAREVQAILSKEIGNINKPTEEAIQRYSAQMSRSLNRAENNAIDATDRFFPAIGKSRAELGSEGSDLVGNTFESAQKDWNAKYAAVRAHPDYEGIRVDSRPIEKTAEKLGMSLVTDEAGNITPVANPRGTPATVAGFSGMPETLTLDQARSVSSALGKSIRDAGVLPGVDTRFRVELLEKVQDEIDNALKNSPGLHAELRDTNAGYRDAMGRYKTNFGEGVLADFKDKEGMLPEAIFQKLTGSNGESYLDDFERLAGRDAKFGPDNSEKARQLVREMILSLGAEKARPASGEVNFGAAYKLINDLPKGVRSKLFPDFDEMGAAFMREAGLGDVKKLKADPEKYFNQYRVGAKELNEALGSRDAKRINELAKSAVEKQKQASAELNALSLDDLARQNEFKIHDYIIDPVNTGKVKGVMGFIEKNNPELASDVKSLFLDDMLNRATKGGKFSPDEFLASIAEPYSSRAGSAGSQGGKYLENAEGVLGRKAVQQIRGTIEKLGKLPEPSIVSEKQQRGFLNWLLLGAEGTSLFSRTGPQALGVRMEHLTPIIKYKIAARFLTDDALRSRAMQPTGPNLERALNRALGIVTQDLARQYGANSPVTQEAQAAAAPR